MNGGREPGRQSCTQVQQSDARAMMLNERTVSSGIPMASLGQDLSPPQRSQDLSRRLLWRLVILRLLGLRPWISVDFDAQRLVFEPEPPGELEQASASSDEELFADRSGSKEARLQARAGADSNEHTSSSIGARSGQAKSTAKGSA